jgi:peptide/nickel transport system permease protein
MGRYMLKRCIYSAISLAALVVAVFFLARLTGNPAELYLPADAPMQVREEFARSHGLDKPTSVQFIRFVDGLAHLDFGESLRQRRPAIDMVLEAFPVTLKLALYAMICVMLVAVTAGSMAARRPNGALDRCISVVALTSASLPHFWLAIVSVLVFAVSLRWLPTSGTGGAAYWVLPVLVLALRPIGIVAQVVRSSMIDALSRPYVKTARAKGVAEKRILFVHALRNAMLPVLTVAGDQAASMINGAVVVEIIFGFPGIGKLMMDTIGNREFVVLQTAVIVVAVAIFVLNLLVDLAYAALDPRIRHG